MAYRTSSALQLLNAATTVGNITVPTGVISSDYCVIVVAWGTTTALTTTISGPVGMTTGPITARRADANLSWQLHWVKGVVAGNTVTVTYSAGSSNKNIQLFAFTADLGVPGAIYSRGGVSQDFQVAPVINVDAGAGVLVFALERTTATGTTISSKVSGSGETVSDVVYVNQDVDPNITTYWGKITAVGDTTPAGPITVTYNSSSGNGIALLFPEVAGTELAPLITPVFTAQVQFSTNALDPNSPAEFKAASAMLNNASHLTIPVPDGTLSTDYVYCLTAWGNATLRAFDYTGTPPAVLPGATVIAPHTDTNEGWTIQVFQGLVTGDSVVVDSPGTGPISGRLYVFDQVLAAPGIVGTRNGVSQTTVDVPNMSAVPGKAIYIFAVERTTADGTTVTNAVNAGGAAVTQLAFVETTADPDITQYLAKFTPGTNLTGITTLTYSSASGNAAAVAIPAVAAPAFAAPLFEPLTNTQLQSRAVQFTVDIPYAAGLVRSNVGRPDHTTIRVKVLTKSVSAVRLAVSTSSGMTSPVFSGSVTPDANGYSYLAVSGLLADTDYWWRVECNGVLTGTTNKLRTWPTPGVPADTVAILVGSCTAGFGSTAVGPTNPNTFDFMRTKVDALGHSARLFIDLGDDFYPSSAGSPNGTMFPLNDAIIRGWWEGTHQQSKRVEFHKVIPTSHTWSDNDYLGSNSDSSMNPTVAALAATIRRQVLCDPPLPASDGKGLYWSQLIGRVLLIQTDARSYSSSVLLPNSTPGKSMLGVEQKAWLKAQFSRSDYVACIWFHDNQWVGNPTTSNSRPGVDNWQAFSVERQEIADYITTNEIKLLMYIHGDNHTIAFDDGTNNVYGRFPFGMVAPIYQDAQALALAVTGGSWPTVSTTKQKQFVWLEITDDGFTIEADFRGIDVMTGAELLKVHGTVQTTTAPPAPALVHEFHYNLDVADVVGGPLPAKDGKDGSTWFVGDGPPVPEPASAKDGDFYLDRITGDVWRLSGV